MRLCYLLYCGNILRLFRFACAATSAEKSDSVSSIITWFSRTNAL